MRKTHQLHYSRTAQTASCRCGRWALAYVLMTSKRAERLARRYGKRRFGVKADKILAEGVEGELSKSEALKQYAVHRELTKFKR